MSKQVRASLNANLSANAITSRAGMVLLPVLPASPFTTNPDVDSRSSIQYIYDAKSLIENYSSRGRKANLNIEHVYNAFDGNTDTRSRGYCAALTNAEAEPLRDMEPGVLYGWFFLSELGTDELAQRLWLYTSAEVTGVSLNENTFTITKFIGHALTNNPATEMPANFSAINDSSEDASSSADYTNNITAETSMLPLLLQYLGLPADTTEDQATVALQALIADQESDEQGFAAQSTAAIASNAAFTAAQANLAAVTEQATNLKAQVATLAAELDTARTAILTASAAENERQVLAAVDAAIADCKATPAQHESLARLARADLSAFNEAMAKAPSLMDPAAVSVPAANTPISAVLTDEEKAFCKAYNFKEASFLRAKQSGAIK